MFDVWQLEFVQRGAVEVLFLGVAAGLLGTWIVLRGLAFFSHAVGAAAFPGLVLADGLAFSPQLGALGTAGLVAAAVGWLSRRDREGYDSTTALVLVAALATGVILASDVFGSDAHVDSLLFGSLLVLDTSDVILAAAAAAVVALVSFSAGPRWLTVGFDPPTARDMGMRSAFADGLLLALVAFAAIAMLSAIGALLATALLVVPAATTRLVCSRLGRWQAATVALACAEGVIGLWISVELNAPPGATIAVLSGAVFALVALGRAAAPAVLAAVALGGCGLPAQGDGLRVVATTTQLGDIVRAVGASTVTQILRPGSDPHDYEPRPHDVLDTAQAQIVFESGVGLDAWMDEVVDQSGGDPDVVVLGRGEEPHWWHDPREVARAVTLVRDALIRADPSGRAPIERNAAAYLLRVRALDARIAACMHAVPPAQRKLVTDHDAFGAFADRYGIKIVGAVIPSQTTQAQPSAGAIADLIDVIERERVRTVFPEDAVSPKLAEAIARDTGATVGEELYGDTLGPHGYLAMERHNADAMVRGFTGGARGCA